jgi:hypothetical protein
MELNIPRDRENTFEQQLIKKNQTRITQMDSQILSLYAKGMTTREIAATFKEMYDADMSPTLISKVTDVVKGQVTEWQNRPLDALYPIVYLDCIVVKVGHGGSVINKAVFLALGINAEGQKELLGMWLAENEGAKFWLVFAVRHWYCRNPSCSRKIFTELLAPFAGSRQQSSQALQNLQCQLGLIAGGEAGRRAATAAGLRASADTLLQRGGNTPETKQPDVGIDE